MRLSVVCNQCEGAEVAVCEHDAPALLEFLLAYCHAGGHSGHGMRVLVDGQKVPQGTHHLHIKCIAENCGNPDSKELSVHTPFWLIGLHGLLHHNSHEGHKVEAYLDGKKIHPPD